MGTSQKKEPNVSGTEKELTPDQTLGLVSLSLMQKLSQKDPSFSWLEEDKIEKVNLKNLRDRLELTQLAICLLYTSPSPRDKRQSRMPSSA